MDHWYKCHALLPLSRKSAAKVGLDRQNPSVCLSWNSMDVFAKIGRENGRPRIPAEELLNSMKAMKRTIHLGLSGYHNSVRVQSSVFTQPLYSSKTLDY